MQKFVHTICGKLFIFKSREGNLICYMVWRWTNGDISETVVRSCVEGKFVTDDVLGVTSPSIRAKVSVHMEHFLSKISTTARPTPEKEYLVLDQYFSMREVWLGPFLNYFHVDVKAMDPDLKEAVACYSLFTSLWNTKFSTLFFFWLFV